MTGRSMASLLAVCLILLDLRSAAAELEPLAENIDLFTVYGIELDVTASTAAQARRQAMEEGRQQALGRLLDKLAADRVQQAAPPPSALLLNRLVRSVDVFDERTSSTRYLARMNIAFNAEAVKRYLSDAGLAYTESRGGPFLLLPLLESAGSLRLVQPHPWRAAFAEAEPRNRLVAYRLPTDDLKARRLLSARRVARADSPGLSDLAKAYDLADAVLVRAYITIDPASGRPAMRYRLRTGRFIGLEESGEVIARASESENELMTRTAATVLGRIDAAWKARTLIAGQDLNRLAVAVPLSSLEDWLAVQARLARVSLLRDIGIAEAGLPVSHLTLDYVGSMEQFRLALEQAQLALRSGGVDASFVLQLAESVRAPSPPMPENENAAPREEKPLPLPPEHAREGRS